MISSPAMRTVCFEVNFQRIFKVVINVIDEVIITKIIVFDMIHFWFPVDEDFSFYNHSKWPSIVVSGDHVNRKRNQMLVTKATYP